LAPAGGAAVESAPKVHTGAMMMISIGGQTYNAMPVELDKVMEHPLVKRLHVPADSLAFLRPENLDFGAGHKRPLILKGPDGSGLVLVDSLVELVLCIEKELHPDDEPMNTTLRTSEVRKHALRLAHEMYESCSGQVRHRLFNLGDEAARFGTWSEGDIDAIFSYLTSSRIMEAPYINEGELKRVRFTDYGRTVIEAAIDKPKDASGPFPPLSVVIGDIGAGAQVAVGSGQFVQERHDVRDHDILRDLVPLLRAASAEMRATGNEQASSLLVVAEDEMGHDGDKDLLRRTLGRFASKFLSGAAGSAADALLAYCKAHGLL
jgi:hypothetical protein